MICCPWRPHQPKERKTKMKRGTKRKENWRKVKVVKVRQLHSSLPPPLPCPSLSLPFSHSLVILSPLPSFPFTFFSFLPSPFTSFSFPSIFFPTLVSVPPFLPHLSLPPLSTIFPSPLGKPSFMIMEPTEEQRQLAEQARTYGKHMVALQSGEGGEGGPPTPVQDEPVTEPAQSVRDGKQKPTGLVMSSH